MNNGIVSIVGLFAALTLALGAMTTAQMAQAQTCPPTLCGSGDPLTDAKKLGAEKIRQKAGEIQSNGGIPEPTNSQVVGQLNAKANQLDPQTKPCGTYVPCP